MAIVVNGILNWHGIPIGKANGVSEGTVINIDYDRPKVKVLRIS